MNRGYFGIGIENAKNTDNIGTLWRSAYILGASFIFTIGNRIKKQSSDTIKTYRHIPYYHYETFLDFYKSIPFDCRLVGVENIKQSIPIKDYSHLERCIYLLGAEDNGLSKQALEKCVHTIILPGDICFNVSVAGSLIMYDRMLKNGK